MLDAFSFDGVFDVYLNPQNLSNDDLRGCLSRYKSLDNIPWLELEKRCKNIIMSAWKTAAANAVYPNIDKLVITTQTSTPADSETSYSGTVYTTVAADEYTRSGNQNPYTVGWNITSESANGTWGSFILIDSAGNMINRSLAGVSKSSGVGRIVFFTGTVS